MSSDAASGVDLVQRVLSGENPELERLAAEGVLPLPQDEVVSLQVRLAQRVESQFEETTSLARTALAELSLSYLVEFIRQVADPAVLVYFLQAGTNSALVEAAIQNKSVSKESLAVAAVTLDERAQEVLLLRQDLITEYPEILEGLASNQQLSSYSRRLIAEYHRHLLAPDPVVEPEEIEEASVDEELTVEEQEEVEAAIAEVLVEAEAEGEYDERTGLTEGQVRMLPLPIRVKLIRGAGRTLRGILVRDSNPQVAVGVMKASAFSDGEAELVAGNRNVCPEVLIEIANRRDWVSKYKVSRAVVKNPRTPIAAALKLLPRLSIRDLSSLRNDRNIADAVRQMAIRLHIARSR